jgi:hypothetical protein
MSKLKLIICAVILPWIFGLSCKGQSYRLIDEIPVNCEENLEKALKKSKKLKKPLLILFTSIYAMGDRHSELAVFQNDSVISKISSDYIFCRIETLDKRDLQESYYSYLNNMVMIDKGVTFKNIGELHKWIQRKYFPEFMIPLYAIFNYDMTLIKGPFTYPFTQDRFWEFLSKN